eukprot:5427006-Pleurochrysis_carterae.AAC.1
MMGILWVICLDLAQTLLRAHWRYAQTLICCQSSTLETTDKIPSGAAFMRLERYRHLPRWRVHRCFEIIRSKAGEGEQTARISSLRST